MLGLIHKIKMNIAGDVPNIAGNIAGDVHTVIVTVVCPFLKEMSF